MVTAVLAVLAAVAIPAVAAVVERSRDATAQAELLGFSRAALAEAAVVAYSGSPTVDAEDAARIIEAGEQAAGSGRVAEVAGGGYHARIDEPSTNASKVAVATSDDERALLLARQHIDGRCAYSVARLDAQVAAVADLDDAGDVAAAGEDGASCAAGAAPAVIDAVAAGDVGGHTSGDDEVGGDRGPGSVLSGAPAAEPVDDEFVDEVDVLGPPWINLAGVIGVDGDGEATATELDGDAADGVAVSVVETGAADVVVETSPQTESSSASDKQVYLRVVDADNWVRVSAAGSAGGWSNHERSKLHVSVDGEVEEIDEGGSDSDHLRVEVDGDRVRVFIDGEDEPTMDETVPELGDELADATRHGIGFTSTHSSRTLADFSVAPLE